MEYVLYINSPVAGGDSFILLSSSLERVKVYLNDHNYNGAGLKLECFRDNYAAEPIATFVDETVHRYLETVHDHEIGQQNTWKLLDRPPEAGLP